MALCNLKQCYLFSEESFNRCRNNRNVLTNVNFDNIWKLINTYFRFATDKLNFLFTNAWLFDKEHHRLVSIITYGNVHKPHFIYYS